MSEGKQAVLEDTETSFVRRVRIKIHGIVQGVGFRPFIHQLAYLYQLNGWVRNQSDGVEIEVAGPGDHIEGFLRDIPEKAPPLARIVGCEVSEEPFSPLEAFHIIRSRSGNSRSTLIAPDVCTCRDCLEELFDPNNRRYRYPFINCTNCGPRYTIIKDIPYDRDKTTMAPFIMCPSCRAEYDDPLNRRFHAQPNACPDCGPQVWLETAAGERIAERDDALRRAVRLLNDGAILAIKGLGGFHLAVDAAQEAAVSRLRSRKIREEKPFAVMFPDVETVRRYCELSAEEEALLLDIKRPIVLLERRSDAQSGSLAAGVAPGNRYLGAFLPYTPLHFLLFEGCVSRALVMTSGNQSDEPIVIENNEARERLKGIADFFLFHDRGIYMRCDDSVVRVLGGRPRPVRRARGYVPVPVFLKSSVPSVLGVGAELKNTVCLTRRGEAFVSQHIGDLENLETLKSFEHTIEHLKAVLEVEPECIVHDLHPDYLSTQWALARPGAVRFAVQHHHAHIAAVVAEHGLAGPVLGLALDGTGYGTDGTIWGGEILLVDEIDFTRLAHFRRIPLPGGARAIKEPWRVALSYLWSVFGGDLEMVWRDLKLKWSREKVLIITQMLERNVNSPLTSSCGRLFDAVAALVGLPRSGSINYEGQAAIELEQAIREERGGYRGEVYKADGAWILDAFPIIIQITEDIRGNVPTGTIAARFHNGVVSLLTEAVDMMSRETGVRRIALSGGVFQNVYLTGRLENALKNRGLEVFSHMEVPANDGCISLGQAYIGAGRLARKA